jgi:hypothetical protein
MRRGITFGRPESWSDRLGKHSVTAIRRDGVKVGEISGESGVAIPDMRYEVTLDGRSLRGQFPTLQAAKAQVCDWDEGMPSRAGQVWRNA